MCYYSATRHNRTFILLQISLADAFLPNHKESYGTIQEVKQPLMLNASRIPQKPYFLRENLINSYSL